MAADIRLIASGTTYYLINSTGVPSAGGAATGASTTPYMVLDDPDAGFVWGLNTPPRPPTPFGSSSFGWPDVTDQPMYIAIAGTNHDTVASNVRQLYQIFNRAFYDKPVQLYFSPNGATSPIYFNIIDAQIDLVNDQVNPFSGVVNSVVARVTITRSPFGGRLTTPETLINAVSFANAGTGAPDNVDAFTTGSGDMIYEGSPCNYLITTTSAGGGDNVHRVILASITTRTYMTPGSPNWNTSGTTYATGGSITVSSALDLSGLADNSRLRLRIHGLISAQTGNYELRWGLAMAASSGGTIYSPVIPKINGDGHTVRYADSGPMPVTFQALKSLTDYTSNLFLQIRSTDGAATTGTLASVEVLLYYDYCDVHVTDNVLGSSGVTQYTMSVTSFAEASGEVLVPLPYPQAFDYRTSTGVIQGWGEIRGTVPRYYSGASLYVRLLDAAGLTSGIVYASTSRTMTVTATHAPQYRLLRGAG